MAAGSKTALGRRGRRTSVRLEDPRAIRALAHPARQQLIEELYNGSVLTATEAARLCGLTPSAMSYHLRALEKWGIVTRGETSGDGRQRPWRAAADQLTIGPAPEGTGAGSGRAYAAAYLQSLHRALDDSTGQRRRGAGNRLARGRLWLTDAEVEALNAEVDAVVERYDTRSAAEATDEQRPRDFFWALVPRTR